MLKFAIFLICLTAALAAIPHGKLPLAGHRSLMEFMVQSRALSQEDPARSVSCFDYYIPQLNGITAEYEKNYATCLQNAEDTYDQIDAATKSQRDAIESDAKNACEALINCAAHEKSIPYFSCFNVEGTSNSKTMYNISANAGETLINVREQYRLVQTEEYRCTNASERIYVENTAKYYGELQSCLQGKSLVPTTAATTNLSLSEGTTATDTTTVSPTPSTENPNPEVTTTPEDHANESSPKSRSHILQDNKWRSLMNRMGIHFN